MTMLPSDGSFKGNAATKFACLLTRFCASTSLADIGQASPSITHNQ